MREFAKAAIVVICGLLLLGTGLYILVRANRSAEADRLYESERVIISRFDDLDQDALEEVTRQVTEYVGSLKDGVPDFADEVYGLKSKFVIGWKVAGDKFARWFTDNDNRNEAEKYIREVWEQHLFTPEEINRELERIISGFVVSLEANRNLMAVEIAADLKRTRELEVSGVSFDVENLRRVINDGIRESSADSVKMGVEAEVISLVAGELATYGVIKGINALIASSAASAATSAGSAAAGSSGAGATVSALSGWWTLGIGVVVGVGIDYGISWYAEGKMVERLNEEIDRLGSVILDGAGDKAGLEEILEKSLEAYREQKHAAVYSAIREQLEGGEL